jgi:hypothetical protein
MKSLFLSALFLCSTSAFAFPEATPGNQCQAKAIASAKAESARNFGAGDAVVMSVSQTYWMVSVSLYAPSQVSSLNPGGDIDASVGVKNFDGHDCEVTFTSVNQFDTRG